MSDYGQGAIDLIEILGVDAEAVVGDLMNKLKDEATLSARNIYELGQMNKKQFEQIINIEAEHKAHLELIDEIAARHDIKVKCRSCDEYYVMDFELSLYDPQHSYCGRSDRCCP